MDLSTEENPFLEALRSDALETLLKDKTQRTMAEKLRKNLVEMSEKFVKLSDGEKQQFINEFKGRFVTQLNGLSEMIKHQTVTNENSEAQKLIPEFGAAAQKQQYINLFIALAFLSLIVLFVVFFGYKLYLSLTEKERKREEKQKAKQAKKKK
ncbi:uncharacterized protein LOC129771525 isoform X2 [Toxorhynchites rutilus septentrionalis]|nr:uncharacterized protein LOC129771525 isoform X2 [Toxorhynchites rutilus septentrionalis]XP_055631244.1 uncharacterized protein LOC129771525 isoform X2 [Toxorhynchites rutilus septentrionalis]